MNKIPLSLLSISTILLHVLVMPIFFLGFILIYDSIWMNRLLETGLGIIFNTLMLTSILIGVIAISRGLMKAVCIDMRINWWQYVLWSLGEVIVYSCFAALYMSLVDAAGYFPTLGKCFQLSFAILPYPYIVFALFMALIRPDEIEASEEDLVRFADTTGRLKLVIAHDVILFVEAQENYVTIHYMEGSKRKEYSLRQSMRGIEELMQKHGIIRCQRSYFVNPRHVSVLRRDKEGFIQAELDIPSTPPVPVSPKFYEQLSKML